MNDAGIDSQGAKACNGFVKTFSLAAVLRGDGSIEYFRGSEMREDAWELEARGFFVVAREPLDVRGSDAEAVHAAVDFQVEACGTFGDFLARCRGIECDQLFAANDGGGNFVGEKLRFFAGPETGKSKNGSAYAGFANLFAFSSAGDAEPVGAESFEGLSYLRATVAVAVAFNDAENLSGRRAIFGFRIYEIAYGVEIVGERGERNIGPDRAAIGILGFSASRHWSPSAVGGARPEFLF